ncbi:uncharacterized protein FN964_014181 [Alca torda]
MTSLQAEDSGTYSCAYRSSSYQYIPLKTISLTVFKALQAQPPDAEERQSEGSTLSIQCPYTARTDYQQKKAWCRVADGQCELLVETTKPARYPYTNEATKGKVTIVDYRQQRTVSITMTNLQAEDSGTYSCAYRSSSYQYIPLKTISLIVFKALQAQPPDAEERQSEGSTLSIQCPYTEWTDYQQKKAWCRVADGQCELLVETTKPARYSYTNEATKGKVTIVDDHQQRTVSITMTNLQAEDSGTYSCAYHYNSYLYIALRTISLIVFKALQAHPPDAEERQSEGSTLSIQCPYTARTDYQQKKAWCRMRGRQCEPLVETTQYRNKATKGKVTIVDYRQQRTVSITITNLQAEDSGTYSCAYRSSSYQYIPLKTISLIVFKALQAHPPDAEERQSEGSTLSIQCPYTAQTDYQQKKAWCRVGDGQCELLVETTKPAQYSYTNEATKGKVTIVDYRQQGIVSITMTNLQAEDSGTYSCAYHYNSYLYIALRTISLTVFKALQAQPPDAEERQSEGSTLSIQCPYTEQTDYQQKKAWCRVGDGQCELLVETTKPAQYSYTNEATKGKVTIVDYRQQGIVSITMTNLQAEDSGTYSCAYHYNSYLYIPLRTISLTVFKALQAHPPDAEERQSEGSTLSIQCPYTAQTDYQQKKAWCRMRGRQCEPLVETTQYRNKATKGKVTIVDDHQHRTVSITMTNLQAEDSGTYSCAYRSSSYQYIPLKTISLIVFKALQAHPPDAEERQSEGSTLSIQCPYTAQTDYQQKKAWCRVGDGQCELLVETTKPARNSYTNEATKGKVTIVDYRQQGIVSITMTNLQAEDSGTYSCAYHYNSYLYIALRTISLTVFKALQAQPPDAEERQSEGSTLSIQCPYTAWTDYQQKKAWCRVADGQCELLVETTKPAQYSYTNEATKGKVTIVDYRQQGIVSITMTNLQAEDSGTYSCAYHYNSYLYIALRTISLTVFKELHTWERDSLSVQCPYSTPGHSARTKVWCRREGQTECKVVARSDYPSTPRNSHALEDRTSIQDDTQKRTVNITMQKLQAQDTGIYWCACYRGSQLIRITEFQLSVSKRLAGTTLSGTASTSLTTPSVTTPPLSSSVHTFSILSGVLSILFILALISSVTLCVRQHKQLKRRGNRQAEDTYDKPEDIAQLDITERMESPKDDSEDLKYVTLNYKSRLSAEDPLYCNVEPSQAHRKPEDENVEYAIIALKQLPTSEKG